MATMRELCGEALEGLRRHLDEEPLSYKDPKFSNRSRGKRLDSMLFENGLSETAESIRDMYVADIMKASGLTREIVMMRLGMKRKYEGHRVWFRGHGEGWHQDNVGRCLNFSSSLKTVDIEIIAGDRPPEIRVLEVGKTTFETWPERADRYLREAQKDLTYALQQEERHLAKARGFRDRAESLKKKVERLQQRPGKNGGIDSRSKRRTDTPPQQGTCSL